MTTTERSPIRFTASREQPCTGCDDVVKVGTRGGYVGGAKVQCEACLGGPDKAAPSRLCNCTDRKDGFTRTDSGSWVHAGCGLPAYPTGAELEAAENEAWVRGEMSVLEDPEPAAVKEIHDSTEQTATTPAEPAPAKPKRRTRKPRTPAAGSGEPNGQQPVGPAGGGVRAAATEGAGDNRTPGGDQVGNQSGAAAGAPGGGGSVADQPTSAPAADDDVLPARLDGGLEGDAGAGPRNVGDLAKAPGGVLATEGHQLVDLSPAAFMTATVPAVPIPSNGNTPWAAQYARELRDIVVAHANRSDRNLQVHLGPSEIGHPCHRQVSAKLAQLEPINHVTDPWASIMGVAGHAWMEECLSAVNGKLGRVRFLTEFKVKPTGFEDHPGTGDGYDADTQSVIDHKFLGTTSLEKLRKTGAPRHYFVQTLLYARGFAALGLPVQRVALIVWPRTRSYLDDMYVWEHVITDEDQAFLDDVIAPELAYRKQWAAALVAGTAQLLDVPADSTSGDCHFCEMYRPASARDGGPGCPGDAVSH